MRFRSHLAHLLLQVSLRTEQCRTLRTLPLYPRKVLLDLRSVREIEPFDIEIVDLCRTDDVYNVRADISLEPPSLVRTVFAVLDSLLGGLNRVRQQAPLTPANVETNHRLQLRVAALERFDPALAEFRFCLEALE